MNIFNKLMYNPGGEDETGSGSLEAKDAQTEITPDANGKVEIKETKTVMEKIREALHDWSNKDEQDQAFDDTRV